MGHAMWRIGGGNTLMRRKWTGLDEILNLVLMKEVHSHGEHVSGHGGSMVLISKVSCSLNETNVLPWMTDAKHCWDLFKL